jgi:hypothetical protein
MSEREVIFYVCGCRRSSDGAEIRRCAEHQANPRSSLVRALGPRDVLRAKAWLQCYLSLEPTALTCAEAARVADELMVEWERRFGGDAP